MFAAVQIIVGILHCFNSVYWQLVAVLETIKTTVTNVLDTIWQYMQSVWESIIGFLTGVINRTTLKYNTFR